MKLLIPLFSVLLLTSCNPQLSPAEKFDKISVGMPLQQALDIFGISDTTGKSYVKEYEIIDTATFELDPAKTPVKVLSIDFDSVYTTIVDNDRIVKKIDNTILNKFLK